MLITRKSTIPEHVAQFVHFLRNHDFNCGISEEQDFLLVMGDYIPADKEAFQLLAKSILVKRKKEEELFDSLFIQYWRELEKAVDSKVVEIPEQNYQPVRKAPTLHELKDWLYNGRINEDENITAYHGARTFSEKDFTLFTSEEQEEISKLIQKLSSSMISSQYRRWKTTHRHHKIDLRKTFRNSISKDLDHWQWKKRKKGKQKISVICDFSKSMELYVRFFLQFIYGFHRLSAKVETFGFGTSLQRISNAFQSGDFNTSMVKLSTYAEEWSGGTRIGESLMTFIDQYGNAYLDKSTYIIIVSDGWDQGDMELLDASLSYVYRRSKKLIWVNPLAGNPEYRPETDGMRTALPYIDHFTSAHNLSSLYDLVTYLIGKL